LSSNNHQSISGSTESRWFLPTLCVLSIAILVLRKPINVLILPARWEDVNVLVGPAMQYSWNSIFVVHYYYFHFIPTLVTFFSLHLFGIGNVLLGMNLAAIIIATLCGMFFVTKQFRFIIKSDLARALCGLFVILVPGITEQIYSNISSIQWFLNIFTMLFVSLLLFKYEEFAKKSRRKKYLYAFFCSASFLSSAFSIVFLPALIYVIIRELRKNRRDLVTIFSYIIPTGVLFVQALTICINYLKQATPSTPHVNDIVSSSVNGFTISAVKIFYQNAPDIFQHIGEWMYLIPVAIVVFVLLNSIRNGIKFEIYVLACIAATLFFSSVIKSSLIDWNCLCGQAQERYFFFAIVFIAILIIRQFDKRESSFSKIIFVAVTVIVTFNVASGFFIPSFADENWKYVTEFYNPDGKYQCYVGEVPSGWAISIPCTEPIAKNMTLIHDSSVTFVPPVQSTVTTISVKSQYAVDGQPVTFTARVFPVPDNGMGQIYIDGKPSGIPATIFGGQITFTELLPEGLHKISASYFGAPNFNASSSGEITITVLSTSDLENKDLEGTDLHGINLSEKNLQGINLSHANLNGANLSGTNLQNSNLSGASLMNVNLKESKLQKSDLTNANLQGSNLSGSDLQDDILSGVILSDADLSNTDLRGANMMGANFAGATTNGCNGCP